MNVFELKQARQRERDRLRRAAWETLAQDQCLDKEHFLDVMVDAFGTHRGRLIARRFVAVGMRAAGATDAEVGAALDVDVAGMATWLAAPLFAPPGTAAGIDRAVLDQFPETLLTFEGLLGPALERARAEALAELR